VSKPPASGDAPPFVSTGQLPDSELVERWVDEALERFRNVADGTPSDLYPALARVSPDLFGICVVATTGRVYAAGDADHEFSVMSVSKPFVFALVCERRGAAELRVRVGANSTGLPFNSLAAVERGAGVTNPMVNAGAIATTSLVPGASPAELGVRAPRAVGLRGPRARAGRRRARVGAGDERA
jgi:glutaminase